VTPLDELLEDLEADLQAWGQLSLYEFSWFLRGLERGLTEDEIASICQDAYEEIRRRHALHLEWFDWPITDPGTGRRAAPNTPPDFDINTKGTIESPFLVLVPDSATP
jgi:hypothetical protein